MTKLTRKLFISLLTVAFAVITLGTTTFAWFTLSSTASIDPVTIDVVAGQGIEISVDGTTFRNRIGLDDIKKAITNTTEVVPLPQFDAVTSPNGYEFNNRKNDPANGFVQFKIWFRSPTENARVYLDGNTTTSSTEKTWKSDTTFSYRSATVTSGTSVTIYGANALRFSFEDYVNGNIVENVFENPILYPVDPELPEEEKFRKPIVFELTPSGETDNMRLDSVIPTAESGGLVSYWTSKLGKNIFTTDGEPLDEEQTNKITILLPSDVKNNTNGLGLTDKNPNTTLSTLSVKGLGDDKNYYSYMMVRLWLEGWDPDCFDAVLNAPISIKFSFSVADPLTQG